VGQTPSGLAVRAPQYMHPVNSSFIALPDDEDACLH